MGNKGSRRKQSSGVDMEDGTLKDGSDGGYNTSSMKRSKSGGVTTDTNTTSIGRNKKMISCPDLLSGSGTVADRTDDVQSSPGNGRQMEIKIYRSYSNVNEAGRRAESRPDIRVYRRNTHSRRGPGGDHAERSQTLPRGFGRRRGVMADRMAADNDVTSGVTAGEVATLPRAHLQQRLSAMELKRQSVPGLYAVGLSDTRSCRRSTSTSSMASVGYRVTNADFPDTATIKRRLAQFEALFTRFLVQLYSNLSESVQLSTLSVAVRPDRANQHISLWQYLTSNEIPVDLLANDDSDDGLPQYLLTIQSALFSGLKHVRLERPGDRDAALSVTSELLSCLAAESAGELARIFEYQIALLSDGLCIELLASQAAHCVIDFLTSSGRHLDRNAIVLGAVRGQHVIASGVSPKLSVIVGMKELKWEIHEILKKPGLRKEQFLFSADIEVDDDNAPWLFRTSYRHDPMLYGYRGLIVEWDYTNQTTTQHDVTTGLTSTTQTTGATYRLNGEDESMFTDDMDWRPDDFHRTYCPYRRLVGAGVMHQFASRSSNNAAAGSVQSRATATLAEYVRRLQGEQYTRDQIQPICRPITPATNYPVISNRSKKYADEMSPRPVSVAANSSQRPLAVCVSNQSTTEDADSKCPVVVMVTPTSPVAAPSTPSVQADSPRSVTDAEVSMESAERRSSTTTSMTSGADSSERSPSKLDYNHIPDDVADNVMVTTVTNGNGTDFLLNGKGRYYGDIDGNVVTVTRHVTTAKTYGPNGNGVTSYYDDSDIDDVKPIVTQNYVIEETTRKTIRSDI